MVSPMLTRRYHKSSPGFAPTTPVRAVSSAGKNVSIALHTWSHRRSHTHRPTKVERNLRHFPSSQNQAFCFAQNDSCSSRDRTTTKFRPFLHRYHQVKKTKSAESAAGLVLSKSVLKSRQVVSSCSRCRQPPRWCAGASHHGRPRVGCVAMANGLFAVSE